MQPAHLTPELALARAALAETTLESIGAALVVFGLDARITWAGDAVQSLLTGGRELLDHSLAELGWVPVASHDRPHPACPVREVLEGSGPSSGLLVDRGGAVVRVTAVAVRNRAGELRGAMASVVPVERIDPDPTPGDDSRLVSNDGLLADLVIDLDGHILDWNPRLVDLIHGDESELVDADVGSVCDVDFDAVLGLLARAEGEPVVGRTWLIDRSGAEVPAILHARVIGTPGGGRVVLMELLDVNEFDLPADAPGLIGRQGFDESLLPMLAISRSGIVVEANTAARRLLVGDHVEIRQDPLRRHLCIDPATLELAIRRVWSGEPQVTIDCRCQDRPARVRPATSVRQRPTIVDEPLTLVLTRVRNGSNQPVVLAQLVPGSAAFDCLRPASEPA